MAKTLTRLLLSLALLGFFLLESLGVISPGVIQRLENMAYDIRIRVTMPNTVDDRIVIADIDEKSLATLGQWPWPRSTLAQLVDTLFADYQINTLGMDAIFAEPEQNTALQTLQSLADNQLKSDRNFLEAYQQLAPQLDNDARFARSLQNRKIVMGFVFHQFDPIQQNSLPEPIAQLPPEYQDKLKLSTPRGYTGNLTRFQQHTAGGFFDNPLVDDDGVFRRVPLAQYFNGYLYPSLAFMIAGMALEEQPVFYQEENADYFSIERIQLGDAIIPVDEQMAALVPYRGKQFSFPYYSISDILEKRIPKEKLENRIVILGTSASGLKDLRATPVDPTYAGVEVHANLVSGILDNRIKKRPQFRIGAQFLLVLTTGALLILLANRLSPAWYMALTLGLLAGVTGFNLFLWQAGYVLPIAALLLFIVLLFLLQMSWGFLVESREKRAITKLFGQYIPPDLVDEIANHPEDISMEGESREMTVLFSDVRGFTTLSEGLSPKDLTRLMNAMLTPMTRIIHENRGTIDKYMGDAIMAFWGAPLADPEHASHAAEAALHMKESLEVINRYFRNQGWPAIDIGIGLNTGEMNVGNMGSEFRMAYTVLGDAVNLGSRLEGLTKQYGAQIIVSESTRQAAPDYLYLELDTVRVKGKDKPVMIYELLARQSPDNTELENQCRQFSAVLQLYRMQEWQKAEDLIFKLMNEGFAHRILDIYLERINSFREHPPGENWDGVFTHTSK